MVPQGPASVVRAADPYGDLDVIDSRAPRFNQATIGLLSLLAVIAGWWWLVGLLALQLVVGLTLGRRYCLPCLAYFELVQPVFGEGTLEDSRPPRFANLVGAVFLGAAAVTWAAGFDVVGVVLGRDHARAARRSHRLLHRLRDLQAGVAARRQALCLLSDPASTR